MPDERVQTVEDVAIQEREDDRAADTHGSRIAIVDNDPSLLSLLAELFQDQGWKSIPCDDSRLAGVLIRTQMPDLILLDVWLETRTAGWELLNVLERDPATRDIPVIVCSGAVDYLAREEAYLEGHAAAVVRKPFDVDDLCKTVTTALARRRASGASLRSA